MMAVCGFLLLIVLAALLIMRVVALIFGASGRTNPPILWSSKTRSVDLRGFHSRSSRPQKLCIRSYSSDLFRLIRAPSPE
jgi:hypothetical protein